MSNDLNDSLDDLLGAPAAKPATPPASYVPPERRIEEPCPKCRGTGRWVGGFSSGSCFKCKGTGRLVFATTRDERAKAKTARASRATRTAAQNIEAFKAEHPEVFAWMDGSTFPFAASLLEAVGKYGYLTENQMAAARRSIEKLAAAKAASTARIAEAKAVDMRPIEAAFAKAGKLLKKPTLRVAELTISHAKPGSANAGALYVRGADYLGKIMNGKFIGSRECTPELEAKVLEVAADPLGAAVAYGRLTGRCACCGRTLSDPESVARGIGPICADKFGW